MDSSTTSVWPTTWRDEPVDPRKVVGFNWFAHGGPKPNQTKRGWCVAGVSLRGLQRCAPSLSSITPFSVSSSLPALERNSDATPSSSSTLLVLLGTAACCIWLNGNKANRIGTTGLALGQSCTGTIAVATIVDVGPTYIRSNLNQHLMTCKYMHKSEYG